MVKFTFFVSFVVKYVASKIVLNVYVVRKYNTSIPQKYGMDNFTDFTKVSWKLI